MDPLGKSGSLINLLLDAAAERHRVISRNLANSETPGYLAQELRFSKDLTQALRSGDDAELRGMTFETAERGTPVKSNGNSVDLDVEAAELSKNAMVYETLVAVAAMRTSQMRSAIAGRSG